MRHTVGIKLRAIDLNYVQICVTNISSIAQYVFSMSEIKYHQNGSLWTSAFLTSSALKESDACLLWGGGVVCVYLWI